VLTTEEEGIALAAGAWLGGQRAVLLMQSSGVGNCINMLSLPVNCRMPFLTLVTMRGEWGEFNPWQVPMGTATPACARRRRRACPSRRPRRGGRRDGGRRRCAGLRKLRAGRGAVLATPDRHQGILTMSGRNDLTLDRRAVVAALLDDPGDLLVVTGLGAATYDAGAAGDRALNFYLWGAMGGTAMIGLGLALAQPRGACWC
jgi:hypothetical protein